MPLHDGSRQASIATCADALRRGELVAFPTETVYGLGADAGNDAAVARIFQTKGRPADHPLIVHVDDEAHGMAGVRAFAASVPDYARRLMDAFWPGPLTLILPRRPGIAAAAAGGQDSIGLRCPAHPVAQALLHACREHGVQGLAGPSANRFGRVSPTTAAHVEAEFGPEMHVLDGGPCRVGIESTIVDCTRAMPVLLRPGMLGAAELQAACGQRLWLPAEADSAMAGQATPRASGTLEAHYAPRAKVRLMDAAALQTALDMLASTRPGPDPVIAVYAQARLRSRGTAVVSRHMPTDAAEAARDLYAALRELDDLGVKLIWVEQPPRTADWDGVRDRLQRAAAS